MSNRRLPTATRWPAGLAGLVIACACAAGAFAVDQPLAKGVVFDDANRNGHRDPGEAGIAKVCVSNGREVVQTDGQGNWSLPAGEDTIFFVIKPSGWGVPVSANQIPQYYYIHKPKGSPKLAVPGVAPTGPLPESINFALHKEAEPAKFRALLFSDTQARGLREVNFITHDVVEECLGSDVAFGISLGDIVADDPNLCEEINQSIAQIGVPWHNVFGNHDTNRDATSDQYSDETMERFYGPGTFAFEYAQVVFIGLDDVFTKPDGGYQAKFTDDQLAFVKNYVATVLPDRLIVLMMHIPIIACQNKAEMLGLIADRPHTLSIAGHVHEQMDFFLKADKGWTGKEPHHLFVSATVSGSWWCGTMDELGIPHATMNDGAPNGYSILSFDGANYGIRFKAARRPADYQMNIYLPDDIEKAKAKDTEILVNIFAGTERSKVDMQFGKDAPWTPLEQTETTDPEIQRMHDQNSFLNEEVFGWKMDKPSKTRHMWKGTLPANPEAGTYTVTVRTTDMYGQTWTGHRIVRIR